MKRRLLLVGMMLAALLIGVAAAESTNRWMQADDESRREIRQEKKELLAQGGLFELHHKVFEAVGRREWESRVKPDFMSAITRLTVQETGNPLPSPEDILHWVKTHPKTAREILETLGR